MMNLSNEMAKKGLVILRKSTIYLASLMGTPFVLKDGASHFLNSKLMLKLVKKFTWLLFWLVGYVNLCFLVRMLTIFALALSR